MMHTLWYLLLWGVALLAALALGLLSHARQAFFSPYAPKLIDGDSLLDRSLNEMMSPGYSPFGEYDEPGWWEFYSLRNYAIHAAAPVLFVIGFGILNWDRQPQTVAWACESFQFVGLTPVFCH